MAFTLFTIIPIAAMLLAIEAIALNISGFFICDRIRLKKSINKMLPKFIDLGYEYDDIYRLIVENHFNRKRLHDFDFIDGYLRQEKKKYLKDLLSKKWVRLNRCPLDEAIKEREIN